MFSSRKTLSRAVAPLAVLASLALAACDQNPTVTNELPAAGATGVDPRAIVAVRLSNTATSVDDNLSDSELFVVTGEFSGTYPGSVILADWDIDVRRGMTVEEFKSTAVLPDPTAEEETELPVIDALVFLLPEGVSFKDGERIDVFVSSDVTSHGTPLRNSRSFSFRVRDSSESSEALRVVSTAPLPGTVGVTGAPSMAAEFNRAVRLDDVQEGTTFVGERSGVHADVQTLATQASGSGVLIAGHRLASGDSFLPGEFVEVSWSSAIRELAGGTSGGDALNPYVLRFQARSGKVLGGWSRQSAPRFAGSVVKVLAADVLSNPGVELIAVSQGAIELFEQTEVREWTTHVTPFDLSADDGGASYRVVDAGLVDLDRDGVAEVVTLESRGDDSRVGVFEIDETGVFAERMSPFPLPAGGANALVLNDANGDGDTDLFVLHPDDGETGFFTVFDVTVAPPDPSQIDVLDPTTLEAQPTLVRIDRPVPAFRAAVQAMAIDLSGNGELDLVVEEADGSLHTWENAGTISAPYALRPVLTLPDRDGRGRLTNVLAWTAADLDGDGLAEIVTWDSRGALVYRGSGAGGLLTAPAPAPITRLDLNASINATGRAAALDLDGDRLRDILLARPDGSIVVFSGEDATGTSFSSQVHAAGSLTPVNLLVADIDGDTGLDMIHAASTALDPVLVLSEDVEAPVVPKPSTFSISLEDSVVQSTPDGEVLSVVVLGDIRETFAGYALALDYDSGILDYLGFDIPADFASIADYTLCPDADGQGCAGSASVRMSYKQSTRGAPFDSVPLGIFRFRIPNVTEAETTTVGLMSFVSGEVTYENLVTIVDGDAALDLPVEIGIGTLELDLSPPPPADLIASCEVLVRRSSDMDVRVRWSSPAARAYDLFEVVAGGTIVTTAASDATEAIFSTTLAGTITIDVRGRDGNDIATASCSAVGVHEPQVQCVAVSPEENRITWSLDHVAERFSIYRNGSRIAQISGGSTEFSDRSPTEDAADLYEVAAVISGVEGPRGPCADGPVGDTDPGSTETPRIIDAVLLARANAAAPNSLRLRWSNAEGYDSITVELRVASLTEALLSEQVTGTSIEFVFGGDIAKGGVEPQEYVFRVRGVSGGQPSDWVESSIVAVPVPSLSVSLACSVDGAGDVRLGWSPVWAGYDDLRLVSSHSIDDVPQGADEEIPLALSATEHTIEDPTPIGKYDFRLVASYTAALPPSLVPQGGALEQECSVDFVAGVEVGPVETGVGLSRVEIPIRARALGTLNGFAFQLDFPDVIDVDPQTGLEVDWLGAVVDFRIVDGAQEGMRRAMVDVSNIRVTPDQNDDGMADGDLVLARLVGSVPADFALASDYPLVFSGATSLRFAAQAGDTPVAAEDGVLSIVARYVILDEVELDAGSIEPFLLNVRGTFPETVPDYRLNSFTIHVKFDPEELELLPVTSQDMSDTVVGGRGSLFLPNEQAIQAANTASSSSAGEATIAWLGFDLLNPSGGALFIEPGLLMKMVKFRFRSRLPIDSPKDRAVVTFVSEVMGNNNPTAFFPEIDVPGVPDLEGFFSGGLRVLSEAPALTVDRVEPAVGSLLGGQEAVLIGTGFAALSEQAFELRLRRTEGPGAPTELVVDVEDILEVTAQSIRFRVPDSNLRPVISPPSSYAADVVLDVVAGALVLPGAYSYEFPRVDGIDRSTGAASGGQLAVIDGAGLAVSTEVDFLFGEDRLAAVVDRVDADGRRLHVLTPDMSGREGALATIEVRIPTLATMRLTDAFTVDGGSGASLRIDSVTPATATICGGVEVVITGDAFLPGLRVLFGGVESPQVALDGASSARAIVPAVPEGTDVVDVEITIDGAEIARLTSGFDFEPSAPSFIRGDVDGDESLSVADVVVLSDLVVGASTALPANHDAADANDDGVIDGGDVTVLMDFLFGGLGSLAAPYPDAGLDPTPDALTSCSGL